jgi:hypothetical protein
MQTFNSPLVIDLQIPMGESQKKTGYVSFKYLYRDASNYKQHRETIFTNNTSIPIEEIEKQIRSHLRDGEFFIAQQVNMEECFFDVLDKEDDHPWHEFNLVETTCDPAFDPGNSNWHNHKRDITEFIADLEHANRRGWDEMNVRADIARMQAGQKRELKQDMESARDVLK